MFMITNAYAYFDGPAGALTALHKLICRADDGLPWRVPRRSTDHLRQAMKHDAAAGGGYRFRSQVQPVRSVQVE